MKRFVCVLIVAGMIFGCTGGQQKKEVKKELMSVSMADAVMSRFPDLKVYLNPSKIKWQYDIAMLGQAIDRLGHIDKKYSIYHEDFINYFVQEDGTILKHKLSNYKLDDVNAAKGLIILYKRTGEEKYLKAIESIIEQLKTQPRTASGGFWHKKIYANQMWLDGLYMAAPFMAQYALEFNQPQWFDVVVEQMTLVYNKTLDEKTGLLYHAWDESKQEKWCDPETGLSKHFWGRAMGWYMMALVDVLDYMPDSYEQKDTLIQILNATSEALVKAKDKETGLWYQVLNFPDREGNYIEGSCSAMFTYAFAKGAKKGYLTKNYMEIANSSFDAVVERFILRDKDNLLSMKDICGAAGLGGKPYREADFEYYVTEKIVTNDSKGVAPFIMAAIELGR